MLLYIHCLLGLVQLNMTNSLDRGAWLVLVTLAFSLTLLVPLVLGLRSLGVGLLLYSLVKY